MFWLGSLVLPLLEPVVEPLVVLPLVEPIEPLVLVPASEPLVEPEVEPIEPLVVPEVEPLVEPIEPLVEPMLPLVEPEVVPLVEPPVVVCAKAAVLTPVANKEASKILVIFIERELNNVVGLRRLVGRQTRFLQAFYGGPSGWGYKSAKFY
jgi:hypothetical protein